MLFLRAAITSSFPSHVFVRSQGKHPFHGPITERRRWHFLAMQRWRGGDVAEIAPIVKMLHHRKWECCFYKQSERKARKCQMQQLDKNQFLEACVFTWVNSGKKVTDRSVWKDVSESCTEWNSATAKKQQNPSGVDAAPIDSWRFATRDASSVKQNSPAAGSGPLTGSVLRSSLLNSDARHNRAIIKNLKSCPLQHIFLDILKGTRFFSFNSAHWHRWCLRKETERANRGCLLGGIWIRTPVKTQRVSSHMYHRYKHTAQSNCYWSYTCGWEVGKKMRVPILSQEKRRTAKIGRYVHEDSKMLVFGGWINSLTDLVSDFPVVSFESTGTNTDRWGSDSGQRRRRFVRIYLTSESSLSRKLAPLTEPHQEGNFLTPIMRLGGSSGNQATGFCSNPRSAVCGTWGPVFDCTPVRFKYLYLQISWSQPQQQYRTFHTSWGMLEISHHSHTDTCVQGACVSLENKMDL